MKMVAPAVEFSVNVGEPELVRPEFSMAQEFKYLSNIDDQANFRHHLPFVHFYPPNKEMNRRRDDPVAVIKMALSKALAHYYPLAGRLRSAEKGKLVVDCCGEGVIFREADADITLEELQKIMKKNNGGLKPPFPQWELLLVDDVWDGHFITDSPLFRMQVTRLACGGFVLAYLINHCLCDTFGAFQFITAISEFSQNPHQQAPSTIPSWEREALRPRSPPKITYPHHEFNVINPIKAQDFTETYFKTFHETSIFFSSADIAALKHQVLNKNCVTLDAIAACLWRARTKTLLKTQNIARFLAPVDTRFRYKPNLSKGYYGNSAVISCAVTKASELMEKPLRYAACLVSESKRRLMQDYEYRASVVDFIELNRNGVSYQEGAFIVSDLRWFKFMEIDFGWGQAVYAGPARANVGLMPGMLSFLLRHKNIEDGVEGILALLSMPESSAIGRFHEEVRKEIIGGLSKF